MNLQSHVIGTTAPRRPAPNSLDVSLRFLSSVKFGIVLMIVLALATLLGTLIVQAPLAEPGQIDQLYAPQARQVFETLGLFDVFHSSWFIALLALLCLNITFASLDRFPGTWEYLRHPQREVSEASITAMPLNGSWTVSIAPSSLEAEILKAFREMGLRTVRSIVAGRTVIFGEKGKYSRLAVYFVHASLLCILLGAMIDSVFGFRAYLSLLEGESSDRAELRGKNSFVQLPFQIRCDATGVEHYPDGTPKKWWSDLVIQRDGQDVRRKRILVNDPMDYDEIRIFQSSFGSSGNPREFMLTLGSKGQPGADPLRVKLRPGEKLHVKEQDVSLRVLEFIPDFVMHGNEIHSHSNESGNPALQVEVTRSDGVQWKAWIFQKLPGFHGSETMPYDIRFDSVRMSHFTGLQIAKQPGQNIIWAGCFLMIAGLIFSFYFSHQRAWALLSANEKGESVLQLGGSTTKNKLDFERKFHRLEQSLRTLR